MGKRPTLTTKIYGVIFLLLGCLLLFLGCRLLFVPNTFLYREFLVPAFDETRSDIQQDLEKNKSERLARLETPEKQNKYKEMVRGFDAYWSRCTSSYLERYERTRKMSIIVCFLACCVFIVTALEIFLRKKIVYNKIYMALIMLFVLYVQVQNVLLTIFGSMNCVCDFGHQWDILFGTTPGTFVSCTSENYAKAWLISPKSLIPLGIVLLIISMSFLYFRRLQKKST